MGILKRSWSCTSKPQHILYSCLQSSNMSHTFKNTCCMSLYQTLNKFHQCKHWYKLLHNKMATLRSIVWYTNCWKTSTLHNNCNKKLYWCNCCIRLCIIRIFWSTMRGSNWWDTFLHSVKWSWVRSSWQDMFLHMIEKHHSRMLSCLSECSLGIKIHKGCCLLYSLSNKFR